MKTKTTKTMKKIYGKGVRKIGDTKTHELVTDFQTKQGRLKKNSKRVTHKFEPMHFDLQECDDSWGFENSPLSLRTKMPLWEKLLYTAILGYFVYYIIGALIFIF